MVRLFVLIKRRGAKFWLGATPAKRGVSLAKLKKSIRKTIKKGFAFRIVTERGLREVLKKQIPKKIRRRKR